MICHFNVWKKTKKHAGFQLLSVCGCVQKCPSLSFCQYQGSILGCRYDDGHSFPPQGTYVPPWRSFLCTDWFAVYSVSQGAMRVVESSRLKGQLCSVWGLKSHGEFVSSTAQTKTQTLCSLSWPLLFHQHIDEIASFFPSDELHFKMSVSLGISVVLKSED